MELSRIGKESLGCGHQPALGSGQEPGQICFSKGTPYQSRLGALDTAAPIVYS
jgi:hypothetical protein